MISEVDITATVLSVAYQEALRLYNGEEDPTKVALTYPPRWKPRLDSLRAGAVRAGIRDPQLVSGPVAAAQALLSRDDAAANVSTGGTVAVFDWGGGTLAIALMRQVKNSFRHFGSRRGREPRRRGSRRGTARVCRRPAARG